MLASGTTPMIFAGDGVAFSGAQDELQRVADLLGAEVWEADAGEVNFDYTHPLYQGMTGHMFGYASRPIMAKGDAILACGTYLLPEVFPDLDDVFQPGAKVVHVDLNAYEIAKNHPVSLGVVADPKLTLAALADALQELLTPAQKDAAAARTRGARHGEGRSGRPRRSSRTRRCATACPCSCRASWRNSRRRCRTDAIVFNEALTSSPALTRYFPPRRTGEHFLTRGGSLGVGIPGAIGVKLANPGQDRHRVHRVTAAPCTRSRRCGRRPATTWPRSSWSATTGRTACCRATSASTWKERDIPQHAFPLCFDLSTPPIRFDEMARSMGVESAGSRSRGRSGRRSSRCWRTRGRS